MSRRRFFVDSIHANQAALRGPDAHHLTHVLRAEPGQQFEISDNHSAYLAEITEARPDLVVFHILEPIPTPGLPVDITVYASLIKFDRFEWAIEKATELGVARIIPIEAARSEKGLLQASRKRSDRWFRIARESSQQSRRVQIPEILPAIRFEEALSREATTLRFFLDEQSDAPLLRLVPFGGPDPSRDQRERSSPGAISLLTGPEGGWTDAERRLAIAASWQPASLSPTILRAETAVIAAIAVLINACLP